MDSANNRTNAGTDPMRMGFYGRLETEYLDLPSEAASRAVGFLREHSTDIEAEISDRVLIMAGMQTSVVIQFERGSVEWFGFVQSDVAWTAVEAMSTVGGALGLIQIVRSAIDGVLQRWLPKALGRSYVRSIRTQVSATRAGAAPPAAPSRSSVAWQFFGFSALLIGLAALLHGIGYLILALK